MAAKRRSVSTTTDLGAANGGAARVVDPLFEFDAPQLFVDLTRAHRHSTGGALPPHDPWFDCVHEAHSKPSYELAQEEAEVQQQQQRRNHRRRQSSSSSNSNSISTDSTTHRRHGGTATTAGPRVRTSAGSALNASAALEKENRIVAPQRRAFASASSLSAAPIGGSSSGGLGGLANSTSANAGGAASASIAIHHQQQQPRGVTGATVSGLPARLRRRSASTPGSEQPLASADHDTTAAAGVERVRAQVKTATVSVSTSTALRAATVSNRSTREPVASHTKPRGGSGGARFMAPTASSRMAAAHKHAVAADNQRAGATSSARAKTALRRPAASSTVSSSSTAAGAAAASSGGSSDLQDLQELLARHNKKFKATHTYQPPQHSVRDVRMWEKKTQQSYYDLSPDARVRANSEIAQLVKQAASGASGASR